MPLFDLSLEELRTYRSASTEPEDFDAFWSKTLQEAREHDLDAHFEPVDTGLTTVQVYDVTFAGFGGHPVKGWLTLPTGATQPLPLVVEFVGYGGGAVCRTSIFCGRRRAARTSSWTPAVRAAPGAAGAARRTRWAAGPRTPDS